MLSKALKILIAAILSVGVMLFSSDTHAAQTLSHPTLQQAQWKISDAINKKISSAGSTLRLELETKRSEIEKTLTSLDQAIKNRNKSDFSEALVQFRAQYFALKTLLTKKEISTEPTPSTEQGSSAWPATPATILYYSDAFEGGNTSNGNIFSQTYFSSARCEAPFNGLIQVINGSRSVVVKNNDRPNCALHPDIIDITRNAFSAIGKLSSGKLSGSVVSLGVATKSYYKKYIPSDTYESLGIRLDSGIPNTYLPNETIRISGTELNGNENTLLYIQTPSGKDISLAQKKNADATFEYFYPLTEVGTHHLIVTSGLGFETSKYADLVVLDPKLFNAKKTFPAETPIPKIQKLSVERKEFSDMSAVYMIRFPTKDFYTLSLTQGDNVAQYSGMGVIAIPSKALAKFDEAKLMKVAVTASRSSTPFSHDTYTAPETVYSGDMMPRAGYRTEQTENIVASVEWDTLTVHGIVQAGKNVHPEIELTLPNGDVKKYPLNVSSIDNDKYLRRGVVFEKTIPLDTYGQYLVELNYDTGFAAYNGSVVYGPILPILPSELDLASKEISASAATVRTNSLVFINTVRSKTGKPPLSLDDTLTSLATIKAQDMADHNYLGHTDSSGQSIIGTAKRNNIRLSGSVGENVAGGNVWAEVLLVGLINSGWHRANMLGNWSKVGIGYVVKNEKVYYVQVFGE